MLKESFTFSEFGTYGVNNFHYFFSYIDYLNAKTRGKLLCICYRRQFFFTLIRFCAPKITKQSPYFKL